MSGSPSYKKALDVGKEMYERLKDSESRLPLLTVIGDYDSPTKNCSALVFKAEGTRLDTVRGMHGIVPVLKKLHDFGFMHCDIRIANTLRDLPKGLDLLDRLRIHLPKGINHVSTRVVGNCFTKGFSDKSGAQSDLIKLTKVRHRSVL